MQFLRYFLQGTISKDDLKKKIYAVSFIRIVWFFPPAMTLNSKPTYSLTYCNSPQPFNFPVQVETNYNKPIKRQQTHTPCSPSQLICIFPTRTQTFYLQRTKQHFYFSNSTLGLPCNFSAVPKYPKTNIATLIRYQSSDKEAQ